MNNNIYILVSACLLGDNTKYNGGNNLNLSLIEDLKDFHIIKICPEVDGGLKIPRDPAEIIGDKVISSKGKDVTKEYLCGALKAVEIVEKYQIKYAILKEKSPSCGVGFIYDGTFSHKVIPGDGITVRKLKEKNVEIYHENNYHELINKLKNNK